MPTKSFSLSNVPNEGTVNVKDFGAVGDGLHDDGPAIQSAIDAISSKRGGVVYFAPGVYAFSQQLTLSESNIGVTLLGAGESEAGQESGPTVLKWTGGAQIAIEVGTDSRNSGIRCLDFENVGSATAFVRVGWTDWFTFDRVNIRPTVFPTTAAIILGIGANRCEHATFYDVTIRGNAPGQVAIAADRAQDFRAFNLNVLNARVTIGIAGSMDIVDFEWFGGTIASIAGETLPAIEIIQGRGVTFHGLHAETNSNNYVFSVSGNGTTDARGINVYGGYISGNGALTTDKVFNVDWVGAEVLISGVTTVQFANPYTFLNNEQSRSVTLISNSLGGTGATLVGGSQGLAKVQSIGNVVDGSLQPSTTEKINVLDYGADDTGATVSNAAFTSAMLVAQSTGKTVYCPPGTYKLNSLPLITGVTIEGATPQAPYYVGSNLTCDNNHSVFLVPAGGVQSVTLRNFYAIPGGNNCKFYTQVDLTDYSAYMVFENINTWLDFQISFEGLFIFTRWRDCVDGYNGNQQGIGHHFIVSWANTFNPVGVFNQTNINSVEDCYIFRAWGSVVGGLKAAVIPTYGWNFSFWRCDFENLDAPAVHSVGCSGISFRQCWFESVNATYVIGASANGGDNAQGVKPISVDACYFNLETTSNNATNNNLFSLGGAVALVSLTNCNLVRILNGLKISNDPTVCYYQNVDTAATLSLDAQVFFAGATNRHTFDQSITPLTTGVSNLGSPSLRWGALYANQAVVYGDKIRIVTSKTPASASDTGIEGEICWDSNYVYVCVAANTWKRTPITTW